MKKDNITKIIFAKFKEFSVEKIWPMIKDVLDLSKLFPDYRANQLVDRKYMLQVLTTIRFEAVSNMVMNARKNRSLEETDSAEGTILIQKGLLEKINCVLTQNFKES